MSKCDFNKSAKQIYDITLWHGCSLVNLLHSFRTPFSKNLLLRVVNAPLDAVANGNTLELPTSFEICTIAKIGNILNNFRQSLFCS